MITLFSGKPSTAAPRNRRPTDTSSARQADNWTVWCVGPVIEASDLLGRAAPCAGSPPMGIIRGMHQSLPAKVKYLIPKQKQALINDWPYLFNVKEKMDIIKLTYLEANHRVIPGNGFISIKLTLRGTKCNYFSWMLYD